MFMKKILIIQILITFLLVSCKDSNDFDFISHSNQEKLIESDEGLTIFKDSYKKSENGITKVYLEGSPFEIGYAHGVLLKDEISRKIETYMDFFNKYSFIQRFFVELYVNRSAKKLEKRIPKELKEELLGISYGSGIEYKDILLLNTAGTISKKTACSGFSFIGKDGKTITGRQIDSSSDTEYENMVLLIMKPNNGNSFFAFTHPGMIDVESGMNEKGLTLTQDHLPISQNNFNVMPMSAFSRNLIQYSSTINDVKTIISSYEELPVRLLLISNSNTASVFEIANKSYEEIPMENGSVAVSNHSRKLKCYIDEDTSYRLNSIEFIIEQESNQLDINTALKILRSDALAFQNNRQSLIFSPSELNFWIASVPDNKTKPASMYDYYGFNLLNELYKSNKPIEPNSF